MTGDEVQQMVDALNIDPPDSWTGDGLAKVLGVLDGIVEGDFDSRGNFTGFRAKPRREVAN